MTDEQIGELAAEIVSLGSEDSRKLIMAMAKAVLSERKGPLPETSAVSTKQGVYLLYSDDGSHLLYVGETGNLRKRRSDLGRTYNHTFRRHLAVKRFGEEPLDSKSKYSAGVERRLDEAIGSLQAVYRPIPIGRAEIEEAILEIEKAAGNVELTNIRTRRKS